MKRIITLICLGLCMSVSAQHRIAQKVNELKAGRAQFKPFSVLTVNPDYRDEEISETVKDATIAKIRLADVNAIVNQANEYIQLTVPYNGQEVVVDLYKVKVLHDSFHLDTDQQKNVPYELGVHYRGMVKGDPSSIAALNFFNGQFNGLIASPSLDNLVIGKLDKPGNTEDYIVYSEANMLVHSYSGCELIEDPDYKAPVADPLARSMDAQTTRCATAYFEMDYQLYVQNGNSASDANIWMTSVFNNVQTLYDNEAISIALKNVFVWTTPDPYTGSSSTAYMNAFNQYRPVFDGDMGQLVGIDTGNLGGVASAVNGICGTNNFSYADVNFSYSAVPTYSWTVQVISHELGHTLGSPHTHSCVWNGNNTPIDNCGPSAIPNSEGTSCMTTPPTLPSTTVKGTIMSYCHLLGTIGINLSNGFGTQPAARITQGINNSTCLSFDCVNTCINTAVNMQASNVTTTSANLSWGDIGSNASWQVAVSTLNGTASWTTVDGSTYNASNLTPNTYYKLRIKPNCDAGMSAGFRQLVFATGADWCAGATITDTGGATANYADNQEFVRVIMPTQPNNKIKINFTSFATENNYDFLWMYNGSSTSAPILGPVNGYTGNASPGLFESTASDGALTLRFKADISTSAAGFVATVACETSLGLEDHGQNIDFTYYPNPADHQVNINSSTQIRDVEVYNVAGQLLVRKQLDAMDAQVDVSGFSTGTYFFKLRFENTEANFKIVKF